MKCILCGKRSGEHYHCLKCYDKNIGSKDYQDMVAKDTPKRIRQKMGIGNIRNNQIKCLKCGDTPRSINRHHCAYCKCGDVAVDGGSSYVRLLFKEGDSSTMESMTVMFDDVKPLMKKHTGKPIKLKK